MEVIRKSKRWGNSLGITIPREIVDAENIREGDELLVDIRRKEGGSGIKSYFGKFKFNKPTQKIKDEMKKGWE